MMEKMLKAGGFNSGIGKKIRENKGINKYLDDS
jgi:hypothetical protein